MVLKHILFTVLYIFGVLVFRVIILSPMIWICWLVDRRSRNL